MKKSNTKKIKKTKKKLPEVKAIVFFKEGNLNPSPYKVSGMQMEH